MKNWERQKKGKRSNERRKEEKRKKERRYPNSRAQPPRSGDCASAWTSFLRKGETEVDYQVAAPTELGTPTMHRATIAQPRVRMEGWRQRRPGSNGRKKKGKRKKTKTHLTHTGLLMEGTTSQIILYGHNPQLIVWRILYSEEQRRDCHVALLDSTIPPTPSGPTTSKGPNYVPDETLIFYQAPKPNSGRRSPASPWFRSPVP